MIRVLSLFFFLSISFASFAQITGRVTDAKTNPIAFVNVILLHAEDSSFITGLNTSLEGDFQIADVNAGNYLLHLRMLGFSDWYSPPFKMDDIQPSKDFGMILLQAEGIALDGVEVTAQRMVFEQNVEGTTINVQNSVMTRGSSVLQVLERSPGVIIDQRNGDFSLNGQNGVLILINGKRMRMAANDLVNFLQSMSADNIQKIELLTNPSAKYDAEGNAGIINIVLDKGQNHGTHGSVSLSAGYGWGDKESASISLNHQVRQINVFGTYSFSRDDSFYDFGGVGRSNLEAIGAVQRSQFYNQRFLNRTGHNINLGMDGGLNSSTNYGVNVTANLTKSDNENLNNSSYSFKEDSLLRTAVEVLGYNQFRNINSSIYLSKALKNKDQLTFNLDHLYFDTQQPTRAFSAFYDIDDNAIIPEQSSLFATEHRGQSSTTVHVGVAKADYSLTIHSKVKLETGVKAVYSTSDNLGQIERKQGNDWITDERNFSRLQIKESIGAVYATTQIMLDSTTQLSGGLRYEYWDRRFSTQVSRRKIGQFFPSIFFSKQLSSASSLNFAYNKRITQPDYNDLASALIYNSEISVFAGNPLLRSSISNTLKLTYAYKGKSLSFSFLREENPIARYQLVENEESNLITVAPQNIRYQNSWMAQANIPWEIQKWWTFNAGGSVAYRTFQLSHTQEKLKHSYWFYNIYGNQQFNLPDDWTLELSGWLLSNHYNGSIKVDGFGMLNFGIKKQLKKGSLQFTITDLLKSMRVQSYYGRLTAEAFDIESKVNYKSESANNRIFRLSYFCSFGSNKNSWNKKGSSGADTEKSRIRID